MEWLADSLLVAGALGASVYCYILARRLSRLNDLESGIGSAVAVLSAQVDDLTKALSASQNSVNSSQSSLSESTQRAEKIAQRLEIMMASFHDLPEPDQINSPPEMHEPAKDKINQQPMFTRHRALQDLEQK